MALRLLEFVVPLEESSEVAKLVESWTVLGVWYDQIAEAKVQVSILIESTLTEGLMDAIEARFAEQPGFRLMLIPVLASLPRPPEEAVATGSGEVIVGRNAESGGRLSREELYSNVSETVDLNPVFLLMVVLSSLVAAAGLLRDNVAVIIGAMVIAPLLGPNVALALATTLGDRELMRRALSTALLGFGVAGGLAWLLGLMIGVDPSQSEIASRTSVGFGDLGLALAAGCAGALSFTSGLPAGLIGVMVAVALLPPLMVAGMLLGAGYNEEALNAALLVLANVICVNLSGVATFAAQGIHPRAWFEEDRARRTTRRVILLWGLLLGVLVVVMTYALPR